MTITCNPPGFITETPPVDVGTWVNSLEAILASLGNIQYNVTAIDVGEYTSPSIEGVAIPSVPLAPKLPVIPTYDGVEITPTIPGKYVTPNFTGDEPNDVTYSYTSAPVSPDISVPEIDDPELPTDDITEPTYDTATAPVLSTITIPTWEDLTLPTISVTYPELETEVPTIIDFNEELYASSLMDAAKAGVLNVINGDMGIPSYLWDAIWERTTDELRREATAVKRMARREWASKGWDLPGSITFSREEEANKNALEQISNKALEIAVQDATMKREDFWNAMQNAAALETLTIDLHNQYYRRLLDYTISANTFAIDLYNASVNYYNAQIAAVALQVEVFKAEIEEQKLILDTRRLELESARLEGDLQRLEIDLYNSQLQAIKTQVDIYNARIQAYISKVEAQKIYIEAIKAKIEAQDILVRTYATEVDAWAKEAQIDVDSKLGLYEAGTKLFSENIRLFGTKSDIEKTRIDSGKVIADIQQTINQQNIDFYKILTDSWAAQVDALNKTYASAIQAFTAQVDAAVKNTDASIESAKFDLEAWKTEAQALIEEYKANIEYDTKVIEYKSEELQTIAKILGQIVASQIGQHNYSKVLSSSTSSSTSCSKQLSESENTNYNYNYDES